MIITSTANPRIKFIRKLEAKKYRQESGQFFIEGLRTVGEAVQVGVPLEALVIAPELLVSDFGQSLVEHPHVRNTETIAVSADVYRSLAHKDGPQGIGAIARQQWQNFGDIQVKETDIWVALDAIADPGNLGTIMRTADSVGARGVILLGQSTDPYDPAAVKASMGALFSLNLIQTEWETFKQWQSNNQLLLVGASDSAADDYQQIHYQKPVVLLMGSERHGLSSEKIAACDRMARIPMMGRSDSLNLAVATAVLLYEIFNQNRRFDTIET